MAFTYPQDGIDDVQAAHLTQILDAWTGATGKGVPLTATAINDPINFAVAVRNLDATNSRALQALKADGTVLFQVDAGGVKLSFDGSTAGIPVTTTSTQTLTNKTLTAPVVGSGLTVLTGGLGVGIAPLANTGIRVTGFTTGILVDAGGVQLNGGGVVLAAATPTAAGGQLALGNSDNISTFVAGAGVGNIRFSDGTTRTNSGWWQVSRAGANYYIPLFVTN